MSDLIPYKRSALLAPFEEMLDIFFNNIGRSFEPPTLKNILKQRALPRLNIYQKSGKLCIDAACPGLKKEDVHVEISEDQILTISANSTQDKEVCEDDYFCREMSKSSFSRSIQLPNIPKEDLDKLTAKMENGILKIEIPFKNIEKNKKRIIEIK